MVSSDRSPLSFLPTEAQVSPPPPYPAPQDLSQPLLQQPPAQEPQAASSLPPSGFPLLTAQVGPSRDTGQKGTLTLPQIPS